MRTRLSIFCDRVIEAGWLAALVIVPLFFNIYSQRVFEPDKLSLLRSLALAMSAAWLIRLAEDWRSGRQKAEPAAPLWRRVLRTPMVLPTLLLVLVYLISTVTSLDWRVSLLGSYQRLQGTYTTLSYIVIFFLMLEGLRTRRQLSRIITTAILVSFPIAMYGLVQHFGLDPLPWGGPVTTRVASNMGNAIFVAAFLIMVVPLTLSRLLENWKEAIGPFDIRDGLLGIVAFVLVAAALLIGMLVRRGESIAWLRWIALAIGLGLQVPIYLLSPAERRPRVLSISLPLTFAFLVGFSWILEIFFPQPDGTALSRYLWLGILASVVFILAMVAFAYYLRKPVSRLILLAGYFVILIAQVVCIFYTQSRGPLLGLMGGAFAYLALLGLVKRRVWLPWLMLGGAITAMVFLILFNTVNWPVFERLRETPYVGRLGQVLQTEEGTGKVRVLIWGGVLDMISPHEPLAAPGENGKVDVLNPLRPIIGYGPESMYVSYNRFYPPDLAHYEKRNASPDRSHNETFDALAITGLAGFLVYMLVFASVFYYGLKWLGLIRHRWQQWTFAALWIGGGLVGAVGAWAWRGPEYIGVGIPAGVMLGVAAYVLVNMVQMTFRPAGAQSAADGQLANSHAPAGQGSSQIHLLLLALVSALVAHFIEIHFGIAIASTRTYFWVYTAMLVVIGTRLIRLPEPEPVTPVAEKASSAADAARRRSAEAPRVGAGRAAPPGRKPVPAGASSKAALAAGQRKHGSAGPPQKRTGSPPPSRPRLLADDWWASVLVWSLVVLLILGTMIFDFVTVQGEDSGAIATIWQSLTLRKGQPSPIMLVLILSVWGMAALVTFADLATAEDSADRNPMEWLNALGAFAGISVLGVLVFALIHASRLKPAVAGSGGTNPLVGTITLYYIFALLCVLGLAVVLALLSRRSRSTVPWRLAGRPADIVAVALAATLPVVAIAFIVVSNLNIVRADILYKQGLSSEKASQWEAAISFYDQAIQVAPNQDFYYLFLGRALMEAGRAAQAADRSAWLQESELALAEAREIAPFNTDHSANLARLYRTWGGFSQEPQRSQMLNKALGYYVDATKLSPHNAQLFDEWGQTYVAMGSYDDAVAKYQESLTIDPKYAQTYQLLGELYMDQKQWNDAIQAYRQAIEADPAAVDAYSSLGYAYSQQGDLNSALEFFQKAVQLGPKNFTNRKNLAIIYEQLGQIPDAIREATEALKFAPEKDKATMESYVAKLRAQSSSLSPEDAQKLQDLIAQGRTQLEAKDWPGAQSTFSQALALDPLNPQVHIGLAYLYAQEGKLDQAITENLAVLDVLPDDYSSLKNLVVLYQQKGEIEKAISAAQEALAVAPESDKEAIQAVLDQLEQSTALPTPAPTASRAGDLPPAERDNMYSAPPPMTIDPLKTYQATIVTSKGNIVLELYADRAPITVNNFVYLARQGFYDNTTFHRVIPDFMAQGGDPTGTGRGGPGYRFADEIVADLRFDGPGVLAMANAGANTNGSQFFITYAATDWLDGKHTIFGQLVEGMDVLQSLTPRDPQTNPTFPGDTIETITIEEK